MLRMILKAMQMTPFKVKSNQIIYKSPFNPMEQTPSFFVFQNSNSGEFTNWKDYASGAGGDHYKLLMEYFHIDFKSAKQKLHDLIGGNYQELKRLTPIKAPLSSFNQPKKSYEIKKVQPLQNRALIEYLREDRKISYETSKSYLEEIYYQIENKNYFGLAFKNNSGGYEVRNKYFKGSFGKKDITLITNGSNTIKIFEGFMDFLSYMEIKAQNLPISDYLILNSLSLLDRALNALKGKYERLESYLDNDRAGDEATFKLISIGAIDKRDVYKSAKDLNEFWINRNKKIVKELSPLKSIVVEIELSDQRLLEGFKSLSTSDIEKMITGELSNFYITSDLKKVLELRELSS